MFKNATEFAGDTFLRNMGISKYPSQTGDSGAAIVHHGEDVATLIGVHRGTICIFSAASEGYPLVDTRHYFPWCGILPSVNNYKIFSAWENVEEELNLVRPG
ncbi:hypothetical protein CENSYa_1249 [Cenarchaeum symbiosum A]|uniref:Uncharacterized protein n=1 Tax=Cenarchaeum symbiosum (strain A) TaxID=414004 RepID=A0RX05_CENSY|nr:hypothetical protein CENSYa_1249 [Cenarchaeum symbiosum A]